MPNITAPLSELQMPDVNDLVDVYITRSRRMQLVLGRIINSQNPISDELVEAWIEFLTSSNAITKRAMSYISGNIVSWRDMALAEMADGKAQMAIPQSIRDAVASGEIKIELDATGCVLRDSAGKLVTYFPVLWLEPPAK